MQQESMSALSTLSATSPSLATYSSKELADIAARVVHELSISHQDDVVLADIVEDESKDEGDDVEDDEEGEFEFAVLTTEDVSADEMFHNGEIKPMYPLFNTELVYGYRKNVESSDSSEEAAGDELVQWRTQDFKSGASHELERIPEGAYCVWAPKKQENNVVALKNKSNSTGSTGTLKRWRLRDLVHRSHSDGKDTFVFLNPSHRINNGNSNNNGGETKKKEKVTAVKGIYGYKGGKKMDEMKKKKSYLPYRPELVGFFW